MGIDSACWRRRWVCPAAGAIALSLTLAGCAPQGEALGDSTWLVYEGPHHEIAAACVKALPATIEVPYDNFPATAQFVVTNVDVDKLDDVRTRYEVVGDLHLTFGGDAPLDYRWTCDVSERLTILRVVDLSHELA